MDRRRAKKAMTMHEALQPKEDTQNFYLLKNNINRGLLNAGDTAKLIYVDVWYVWYSCLGE